uniref:uncharacterized protein n=1 Tax=Centroberyx gerrardi TaxID=166262 RepID=UPI003AAC92D7
MSPGLRLLPPSFTLPSPCSPSIPVTTVTPTVTPTSPVSAAASHRSEEEGPASFEAPPTATEGSILPSINKGRARLSIRRRPPSRRNRKSSSGDEVGVATGEKDTHPSSPSDPEAKTAGGEEGKDGEVFNKEVNAEEVKKEETESDSVCPEGETEGKTEREEPQEPEAPSEGSGEEEKNQEDKENGPMGEEEEAPGPSGRENQEEPVRNQEEELEETSGEEGKGKTDTDSKEEDESKQTKCQSSDGAGTTM